MGSNTQGPRTWQTRLVICVFAALFAGILARAFFVQVVHSEFFARQGDLRFLRVIDGSSERAEITDSEGLPLVASFPTRDIFVVVEEVQLRSKNLDTALNLLGQQRGQFQERLVQSDQPVVVLSRNVPLGVADEIRRLNLTGFYDSASTRREIPLEREVSFLVGIDSKGRLAKVGLEAVLDQRTRGAKFREEQIRDRLGRVVEVRRIKGDRAAPSPVRTTIDLRTQVQVFSLLRQSVDRSQASAGTAAVVAAETGEILAVVGASASSGQFVDRELDLHPATLEVEPGSMIGPVILATLQDHLDLSDSEFLRQYGGLLAPDANQYPMSGVRQIASGAGEVWRVGGIGRVGLRIPPSVLGEALKTVGFGQRVDAFGPESTAGRLYSPERWSVRDQADIARGIGLKVTPMQLVRSLLPLTSDVGEALDVSFTKSEGNQDARRRPFLSEDTAKLVRGSLEARGGLAMLRACRGPGWGSGHSYREAKMKDGTYHVRYVDVAVGWCRSEGRTLLGVVSLERMSNSTPPNPDHLRLLAVQLLGGLH